MSKVFHRTAKSLPVAVKGEGVWITDRAGRKYLDASSGGVGLTCLGFRHPRVVEAITRQASTLPFIHSSLFTTDPLEELADELVTNAPPGLEKAFFVSGGSEAIEAALMIAKQCAVVRGELRRNHVISRHKSFHGGTIATLGVGDFRVRKKLFEGFLPDTIKVSAPYEYREMRSGETDQMYGERLAKELEAAIGDAGPETILAFIAETVSGGGVGALSSPPGYFKRVREICDRHGIFLILDEVYCGLGRTGKLHACEAEGIVPDILVVAKGLAAGFAPIGAVLTKGRIHEEIKSFGGGFTHSGHTLSCVAALVVQRTVREEGLVENAEVQGNLLRRLLEERFGNHRYTGDIRGRGMMQAIEFVSDRNTKEPFDPEKGLAAKISQACLNEGLICWAMNGVVDGYRGDHVMLAPAFIVRPEEVHDIVDRLERGLDKALERV
ncbi:aspartate aminotransferase family protein [Tardiphaga sp. 538_B7_N1_4]|uniref:aspartate aminotransferase family protein n=1 Tax=Tardiphaga sp. 538_B7_N1_4 TaxID=3240778 RepID=UPI001B8A4E6A|nr:aspartate aminotransferase family protein [Bradyrhizobium diazoefficiens]MBR0967353.1 aspartate aminotransferase family protein [Bradyrhizobium diazoefficiens]MBR0976674.1 aspartate aminotransferase family protein [Bradyrhizobium diazoefficiens]MBR1005319.1 aspartate aminotransferase family protein [Bradyrhizobium diazoefficiens]MBR1011792.1 aspartate aminotransferase family protein [Bradyrhizobium diazoefficiens]MBR1049133.1 aspartate aminotransferase family protein [Bradyrhizobium diazoef